jgi:CRP-like cAMP-binding protein
MVLTWNLDLAHTANGALVGIRRHDLADQVIGGLRALGADRTLRAIVAAMAVGSLAVGALDVLGVVFASVRLDADGGSLAGLLAAAVGIGSIIGSLVAGRLIGRSSLMRPFLLSAAALGVPIAALAAVNRLVPAMTLFALVGVGRSVLTVTGAVALQRLAPRNLLVRIFGVHEGLTMLAMAVGALTIPPLVEQLAAGQSFGEIALLRDAPREATITAITPVELLTVGRAAFLEAVNGHPQCCATADQVVAAHLSAR